MGFVDRFRNEYREKVFKEILGKRYSEIEDFDVKYEIDEEFILMDIKRLVFDGNVNKAEDTLYTAISKKKTKNLLFIAGEFYTMLSEMSDEEIEKANFTREEISDGINEIKKIFNVDEIVLK